MSSTKSLLLLREILKFSKLMIFGSLCQSSRFSGKLDSHEGIKDESDVLIECRDVHKSFGDKQILRGVSFKVYPYAYILLLPQVAFLMFLLINSE
jgi:hypothetical protein